jgi:polyhydroxybutyrate depolymerase
MTIARKITGLVVFGLVPATTFACASDTEPTTPPTSTGGTGNASSAGAGAGGAGMGKGGTGTGGTTGGVGGTSGVSTGGAGGGKAGASATGGAGGVSGSGGSGAGIGGTGGAAQGGASTGGAAGSMAGGSGSSSAGKGGTAGAAGTPGTPSGDPDPSAGCGMAPTGVCDQQGAPCTANGLDYFIDMPADYDETRPYPVVFQYHPLGGSAQGARNMYRVRPIFMDAIYVSPAGSDNGFPNSGGVDEEMTRSIMETIEANLCVDRARYFATGFSYGGSMSYTAAFCIGDKFRAIAPMAGATISGASRCDPERPVAAWINHGDMDTALPIEMSIELRDELLEKNGCSDQTMPVDPSPCVAYQGCQEGYPIIWCEQAGVGHAIPSYGAQAIADFFMQF